MKPGATQLTVIFLGASSLAKDLENQADNGGLGSNPFAGGNNPLGANPFAGGKAGGIPPNLAGLMGGKGRKK